MPSVARRNKTVKRGEPLASTPLAQDPAELLFRDTTAIRDSAHKRAHNRVVDDDVPERHVGRGSVPAPRPCRSVRARLLASRAPTEAPSGHYACVAARERACAELTGEDATRVPG